MGIVDLVGVTGVGWGASGVVVVVVAAVRVILVGGALGRRRFLNRPLLCSRSFTICSLCRCRAAIV